MLNKCHVEHSGHPVLIWLDTPDVMTRLVGQDCQKSTNRDLELCSQGCRPSSDGSLRVA